MKRWIAVSAMGAVVGGLAATAPAAAVPPPVGTCWTMSASTWTGVAVAFPPGDCAAAHNAETTAVPTVPESVAASGYGSAQVLGWAAKECQPFTTAYVWATDKAVLPQNTYAAPISAVSRPYLAPRASWDAGERWVSCMGVTVNPRWRLSTRTGSVADTGLRPRQCLTYHTWTYQPCGSKHVVPMTNQVWIAKQLGERAPDWRTSLTRAERACKRLAGKGTKALSWYVPSKKRWNRGDKFAYCEIRGA